MRGLVAGRRQDSWLRGRDAERPAGQTPFLANGRAELRATAIISPIAVLL
jgi:hypothetical protein